MTKLDRDIFIFLNITVIVNTGISQHHYYWFFCKVCLVKFGTNKEGEHLMKSHLIR